MSAFFETHCHLHLLKRPLDSVVQQCKEVGVNSILTVTVDESSLDSAIAISCKYDSVICSQGIHPLEVSLIGQSTFNKIVSNIQKNPDKVVAIGEVGLDFFPPEHPPPEQLQVALFEQQLQIALDFDIPVIIHTRFAEEALIHCLNNFPNIRGVIHSFQSSTSLAKYAVSKGLYIGFNGLITRNSRNHFTRILESIPLELILLETDSPWHTPNGFRGQENSPSFLPIIVESAARLLKLPIDSLSTTLVSNATTLFLQRQHPYPHKNICNTPL